MGWISSFFVSAKSWLLAGASAAFGVLFLLFKYKSAKLEVAEKEVEHLDNEIKTKDAVVDVTTDVALRAHKKRILMRRRYENRKREAIENITDKPLSPELLRMLRSKNKD